MTDSVEKIAEELKILSRGFDGDKVMSKLLAQLASRLLSLPRPEPAAAPPPSEAQQEAERVAADRIVDALMAWDHGATGGAAASAEFERSQQVEFVLTEMASVRALRGGQGWVAVTDDPKTWPPASDAVILTEHANGSPGEAHTASEMRMLAAYPTHRGFRWMPWPTTAPIAPDGGLMGKAVPAPLSVTELPDGVRLIATERLRQIHVEGWTPEHDELHEENEMLLAANCYLQFAYDQSDGHTLPGVPEDWPWESSWWKPSDSIERNLVKAGALVAAEIDRLRAAARAQGGKA